MLSRRIFLQRTAAALAAAAFPLHSLLGSTGAPWFEISLAQWSLHRAFRAGLLDAMDFARIARRDYGIRAIEYVNSFYQASFNDGIVRELKRRADSEGVKNILIMCDKEGKLGDPDPLKRTAAVANHHKWVDAARSLGCHSIRVNAYSEGTYEEQLGRVAKGLHALCEYAAKSEINVIVENHGGLSSNGAWVEALMKRVDHPRCGTLPDFGNFRDRTESSDPYRGEDVYDRYQGVAEMMPWAKGVSAKSIDFDEHGNETKIDYRRLLGIVKASGYRGPIGIEYEGTRLSEPDGIRATKTLLEKLRAP